MIEHTTISVREIQEQDIELIAQYWLGSDESFLINMGVDVTKIPSGIIFTNMLSEQLHQAYIEKKSYCVIWEVDGRQVGHSNVNKIIFGQEAFMHLHIWIREIRRKGYGEAFIKKTLPYFFDNLNLNKLYCEPYALNAAPNNTLKKVGFEFIKQYITIPGYLNFEQPVNLWELTNEKFRQIK